VNQSTFNRIDLPIVKHHFALAHAFDVDRKDRIASGFGAKDGSQITEGSDSRNSLCTTAINCYGHHAVTPRAPRIVFAATVTHFCLHLVIFFLRHEFSLQTFSDKLLPIFNCQLPIFQSAIGNRKSEISQSLMVFV